MPDAEARALGAGGKTIAVAGRECSLRPLGMRELTEVERDCLERYKRQYLKTIGDNLDLLPDDKRDGVMVRKFDEVGRWDLDSLPTKFAHDADRVRLTKELRQWLVDHWRLETDISDLRLRQLASAALDQEALSEGEYGRLTDGAKSPKVKVPYVHWWITGSYDGMITLLWTCFKADGVSREQVMDDVGSNLTKLAELAREIERLSVPAVGNG